MMTNRDMVVVLVSGYLARFMLSLTNFYDVRHTSRSPNHNLTWVPSQQRLRFDLTQPDTWSNIPSGADLLWCFPAAPVDAVRKFAQAIGSFGRLVVLGSTSAYDVAESNQYPPHWIDESAPIDLKIPRVQGEEFLREECGAIVLRVSGMYGPNRNPLDWIRTGRVKPSRKYVNLIHVEDLANVCLAALERGRSGEVYNVSDGTPRTWNEIYATAHKRWGITAGTSNDQAVGKRISNRKARTELQCDFLHLDLYASLEALERSRITQQQGLSERSTNKAAGEDTPEA
jgi:hypothetical protein